MTDTNVNLERHGDSITTSWLSGIRQGEELAWQRLLDMYLPLVYLWCRRQGLQDADVLDVGQDVLQRLAKGLGRFRRDRPEDSFRGWLRQITKNAIGDHFRKKQKQGVGQGGSSAQEQLASVPAPEFDDAATLLADEVQILHHRIVAFVRSEFSEQDWQAYYRITVENQAPSDVAETLGITRNQVYLAKSRIQKRLREEFGAFDEGK